MCVEHNLFFYNRLMQEIRDALDEGRFSIYKKDMLEKLSSGDGI
jgi:queuine tRNA-ribosyltransferase